MRLLCIVRHLPGAVGADHRPGDGREPVLDPTSVLPTEAYDIVIQQIRTLAESPNRTLGWSFVVSIGLELWSAMSLT